jgi:hypothetical protein
MTSTFPLEPGGQVALHGRVAFSIPTPEHGWGSFFSFSLRMFYWSAQRQVSTLYLFLPFDHENFGVFRWPTPPVFRWLVKSTKLQSNKPFFVPTFDQCVQSMPKTLDIEASLLSLHNGDPDFNSSSLIFPSLTSMQLLTCKSLEVEDLYLWGFNPLKAKEDVFSFRSG